MIVKGFYAQRKDGVDLYRTFSDRNLPIQKEGTDEIYYPDAIDVEGANFKYVEVEVEEECGQ